MNMIISTVLINIILSQTIFADLYIPLSNTGCQNVPGDPTHANYNNLAVGNNVQTTSSLPFTNSLPVESNLPANKLHLLTGFPFMNGLVNEPSSNGFLQNNLLQIGNNLRPVSNLPMNNILSNNLPAVGNLPLPMNSPNNLQYNVPNANIVTPVNPSVNTLQFDNNMANRLENKGTLTTSGVIFNNGFSNVNDIANMQTNLANVPKVPNNLLPYQLTGNSGLPMVNNNRYNNFIENNAFVNAKQSATAFNSALQFGNVPNNVQVMNGLAINELPLPGSKITNIAPVNIPAQIPVCENLQVPSVPASNRLQDTLVANNFNNLQTGNVPLASANKFQLPFNTGVKYIKMPTINNVDCHNSLLNGGQSMSPNLQISDLLVNNFPASNLPTYNLPVTNALANNNLPVNNLLADNLAGYNLTPNNIGSGLPLSNNLNLPSSLPNTNFLNLGALGSLPIFNGLPVIGVTETVTVINTAPSLYL